MDKLKMAHDWAMKIIEGNIRAADASDLTERAWKYADAMQAEAEEREPSGLPEALCEVDWRVAPDDAIGWMIFDGVSTWLGESGYLIEDAPSFGFTGSHIVERPDVLKEEWQPDWSQAPDDATAWEYLGHGSARWHTTTKGMYRAADLFGYGSTDMLLVERPNGF